jgi:orotidine-5'-phosphate decarboxylase
LRRLALLDARDRLIVALDVPSVKDAEAMVTRLGNSVSFYKFGYQLAFAGGIPFAAGLIAAGKQVFLDLKLHDIGNTVTKGVESVAQMGATFLTVHAYPQTMRAAVEGARGSKLKILAVTVLTSYDESDMKAAGYSLGVSELVARRAEQARDIGINGLVCSPEEAANLRPIIGSSMSLVTPGIRPLGAAAGRSSTRPIRKPRPTPSSPRLHRRRNNLACRQRQNQGGGHGQGLLDRARRCDQCRGLPALCRRQCGDLQEIRWQMACPRRQAGRQGRRGALSQCGDGIPGLCRGTGLLQFAGISGQHENPPGPCRGGAVDHRGL